MTTTIDYGAILASGSKQKQARSPIVVAYADRGLGKTTFGAAFPKPAFLCGEDGAHSIADFRWPSEGVFTSWGQLLDATRAFAYGSHDFKTIVADTVGPLATLCMSYLLDINKKPSWDKMGWGKDEDLVREWRIWLSLLEQCRTKQNMNVVLLAHSTQKKVTNTQLGDAYYVFQGDMLNSKIWEFTSNWADIVLYGAFELSMADQEHGKMRALVKGPRWFHAQPGTGYEAKVRGGYWLPEKFDLTYQAYQNELNETPTAVRARLIAFVPTLTAEDVAPNPLELVKANIDRYIKQCGDSVGKLRALEAQVKAMKEPKEPKK